MEMRPAQLSSLELNLFSRNRSFEDHIYFLHGIATEYQRHGIEIIGTQYSTLLILIYETHEFSLSRSQKIEFQENIDWWTNQGDKRYNCTVSFETIMGFCKTLLPEKFAKELQ
jgi:hypothetical protein